MFADGELYVWFVGCVRWEKEHSNDRLTLAGISIKSLYEVNSLLQKGLIPSSKGTHRLYMREYDVA